MPPPRKHGGKRDLNTFVNSKFAFTLAEVLITLGVVGVVAAMTLPSLINSGRGKQYEAGFKAAQSLLGQAVTYLHSQDIFIYNNNYGTANAGYASVTFSTTLAEAFTGIHALNKALTNEAGTSVITTYKTFSNKTFNKGRLDDGSFELANGMSVFIETDSVSATPIVIFDVNGSRKKPNRLGYDTFAFIIDKDDRILPLGSPLMTSTQYSLFKDLNTYCDKNSASLENGISCAYKAFTEDDYFKNLK